jgi:hypothetical protein
MIREGNDATFVQRCAVLGNLKTIVRQYKVSEPQPYAQYSTSVRVSFVKPRKRRWRYFTTIPDNIRYVLIMGASDELLYDSRTDVPCDMAKWWETRQEFKVQSEALQAEGERCRAEHPLPPGITIQTDFGDFSD